MAEPTDALKRPRRFYQTVDILSVDGAFALSLDSRTPRSPGGRALSFPTLGLAQLIAEEWRRQGAWIDYADMPATKLAHTALDVVASARSQSADGVLRFAAADLVCYFAEGPDTLVRRQEETWGALLAWIEQAHGLWFRRATGIVHQPQPPETLEQLARQMAALDDFALAGLAFAAALLGSAVLALALMDGCIDAREAMAASRLDEIFQEERWGVDAEAARRVAALTEDAAMAQRWFAALRPGPDQLVTRGDGV